MKFRCFLSALLFGLGCMLVFIGLITALLPSIPNPQLQLAIAAFAYSSENAIVNLFNKAMHHALQNSWQVVALGGLTVLAGAGLLVYFTPKASVRPTERLEQPTPPVILHEPEPQPPLPKKPNPFAVATTFDAVPAPKENSAVSFVAHAAPILARNSIPEASAEETSPHETKPAEPFFSARFETESHAIETQRGFPSQSGSSLLIRNTLVPDPPLPIPPPPAAAPETEAPVSVAEPIAKPVEETAAPIAIPASTPLLMPSKAMSAPPKPTSSRIRTTIGRKTTH